MGLCASSNNTVKADAFTGSPVPSPVNETKEQKRGNKQGRGSSVKKTGGTTKRPQVLKKNTGIGGGGGAKVQRKISRPGANTLEVSRHVSGGNAKWNKDRISFREQMKRDRAKFRKQMKSKKKQSGANSNGFVVEIRSPKNQVTSKKGDVFETDFD